MKPASAGLLLSKRKAHMTPADFIAAIAPAAQASMLATGIPASFTVAEGALESGWGASQLTLQAKNLFGVKADASWHGAVLEMQTREYLRGQWVMVPARWRKYDDWDGCIGDHAAFLRSNQRYSTCFQHHDGPGFAAAVAAAGYATDPHYAQLITALITQHGLGALDAAKAPT